MRRFTAASLVIIFMLASLAEAGGLDSKKAMDAVSAWRSRFHRGCYSQKSVSTSSQSATKTETTSNRLRYSSWGKTSFERCLPPWRLARGRRSTTRTTKRARAQRATRTRLWFTVSSCCLCFWRRFRIRRHNKLKKPRSLRPQQLTRRFRRSF